MTAAAALQGITRFAENVGPTVMLHTEGMSGYQGLIASTFYGFLFDFLENLVSGFLLDTFNFAFYTPLREMASA